MNFIVPFVILAIHVPVILSSHVSHDGCYAYEYPFYSKEDANVYVKSIRRRRSVNCNGVIGVNVDCDNELSCECNKNDCRREVDQELYCGILPQCIAGEKCSLTTPCPEHYTATCIDIDECASNPCLNGGSCFNGANFYNCTDCDPNYTGTNCEIDMCRPSHPNGADVVFLVDSSLSQGIQEFDNAKEYIKNFIANVPVGPSDIQVAMVTFSLEAKVEFYLNNHTYNDSLVAAVDNVQFESGPSFAGKGFKLISDNVLSEHNGHRPNTQSYVIILSDGLFSDRLNATAEATVLIQSGVRVFSVGTGNQVYHTDLIHVATDWSKVFTSVNDDVLQTIRKYHVMDGCSKCNHSYADVAVLLDASAGITARTYARQIEALAIFLQALTIAEDAVRVSYTLFADDTKEIFTFDDYFNVDEQIIAINVQNQFTMHANETRALRNMGSSGFLESKGSRTNARKVMLFFTNGNFDNEDAVFKQADVLKSNNITLITVATDSTINMTSLVNTASDPSYAYIWGDPYGIQPNVLFSLKSFMEFDVCSL